jgi:hypothetical protein
MVQFHQQLVRRNKGHHPFVKIVMAMPVLQSAVIIRFDGYAVKVQGKMLQIDQAGVISMFMPEYADQRMFRLRQSEQPVLLGYGIDEVWLVH